jgi:hypothetical protein
MQPSRNRNAHPTLVYVKVIPAFAALESELDRIVAQI